jgi:hypothetical protein
VSLGLIGGAIVTYGTPWQGLLLAGALVLLGSLALWHLLGFHDAPRLLIEADTSNRVGPHERDRLDWPHIAVRNIGQARARSTATATGCRASIRVDGANLHRLRWDSEKAGGDTETNLVASHDSDLHPSTIPFLIRHTRPFTVGDVLTIGPATRRTGDAIPLDIKVTLRVGRYGAFLLFGRFDLEGGNTYLCDDELLTQTSVHGGGMRLVPGRHFMDVTVTYDRTGE